MGFSTDDAIVRGELFNRRSDGWSGKWKYTIELNMREHCMPSRKVITCVDAVKAAWLAGNFTGVNQSLILDPPAEDGYWLVVQDPYFFEPESGREMGYPVMVAV
jgi:hypothetical protein